MKETIGLAFRDLFGSEPIMAFAPGRINLIGEHTDYQEGFVFPAAVAQGIYVAIQANHTDSCRLYSFDFKEEFVFSPDFFSPKKGHWANYVMGMVSQMKQAGYAVQSFDLVIGGDIPVGAGLSSSAAFSVAIGTAISGLFGFNIPKKSIVIYAQKSEHLFAGVNCGIMDPYASAFGESGHALLLDCRTNSHKEVKVDLGAYTLMLVNSKVKHSLADTAYNKRRAACEESVVILRNEFPGIATLRDVGYQDLDKVRAILPSELFPKAKHVITENERVIQASLALEKGKLDRFGELLKKSHLSLSQDYEVSCEELDFLAGDSWNMEGILGSRMMGGGFGGCTINLVKTDALELFQTLVKENYNQKFGIDPDFIPVHPSGGARIN